MATGYDNRQPTRQTFAFTPASPPQVQARDSGQSRGARIVGGQSQGGAVAAGPQADAGPVAAGLGQFVETVMRPHIERRQQEEFFNGFTAAQQGQAVEEIAQSHGGFSKVFGPTAYLQGAEFYTAKSKVDQWVQERYAEMDTLKRMPENEAAKVLAQTSQDMMTGDPFANQLIQSSLIEVGGPLMSAVGKARYAWQQSEAISAATTAWSSGAKTMQTAAVMQASLKAPSDAESAAFTASAKSFLGSMAKPEGMDDETYRTGLYNFMRGAMQDGSFYAVKLMREAGVDKVFSEDQQIKLADAERRYGDRVIERASIELLTGDMAEYEAGRVMGNLSPMEAAQRLGAMNAKVRAATGVDDDLFDFKSIKGEVRSMAEMVKAAHDRAQDRVWQLEDRRYARETRRLEREAEEEETSRAAGAAWASGDVSAAEVAGIEGKHFERIALADLRSGKLDGLARAFRVGQYVASGVKKDVQASVAASVDQQYGQKMAKAHQQWQAMFKANPGMTASYYGEWHEKMRTFDTLSRSVGPTAAYTRAFGDSARYSAARLPPERRKEADTAIADAVNDKQGSSWNPFDVQYSDQAIAVMQGVTRERVAMGMQNSDAPAQHLAKEQLNAAMADGSIQVAAGEAWRGVPGSKQFRALLGLQQDEADKVFASVVDSRLKAAGFASGMDAKLEINYVDTPKGDKALHVVAHGEDGETRGVIIGIPDFKAAARKRISGEVTNTQPTPAQTQARTAASQGLSPYRRIKGETGWQRVIRINREVAAGGNPTH